MNWDQIEGRWKELKGSIKERFGKLTDSDFQVIEGKRDRFLGMLQKKYGYAKEEAERQLDDFVNALDSVSGRG